MELSPEPPPGAAPAAAAQAVSAPSRGHSPARDALPAAVAATPAWVMIPGAEGSGVWPARRASESAAAACFCGAGGARARALLSPRPRRLSSRPLPPQRARALEAGDPAAERPQLSQPPSPRPSRPSRGRRSARAQPSLDAPRARPSRPACQSGAGEAAAPANRKPECRCARLEGGRRRREKLGGNRPQAAQ